MRFKFLSAIVDQLAFVDISRRYGEAIVLAHPADWELIHPAAAMHESAFWRRVRREH
ncbi:MAG: hypothetical protein K8S98_02390 [Planctomycetes bacterium]|nr:hypothetical protein [Planctomycetota bacterium]